MRLRKSGSIGEIRIDDDDRFADDIEVRIPKDEKYVEGYVVDNRGRVRGEAKRFDPYSRIGEIMLYDIDSFGFVYGYVDINWSVMSEQDLLADKKLAGRLYEAKYQAWKRCNIMDLHEAYDRKNPKQTESFERFCRELFKKI